MPVRRRLLPALIAVAALSGAGAWLHAQGPDAFAQGDTAAPDNDAAPHQQRDIQAQRDRFLQARQALESGERERFLALRESLRNYPLLPYLDYADLTGRLESLPSDEVDRFLAEQDDVWLADRLERLWVHELAKQERWEDVVAWHDPANSTIVLRCLALRARLATGDRDALDEVAPLWNVNRSQYNECDPVFEEWMAADRLTPELAWDRLGKVIAARRIGLARYIAGLMPESWQSLAELYLLIDSAPEQLDEHPELRGDDPRVREIVLHGIDRLARIDAPRAMAALQRWQERQALDKQIVHRKQQDIALQMLLQGFDAETDRLLREQPELISETLVSGLLRDALHRDDWKTLAYWLERLPAAARDDNQWRYWRARVLEQSEDDRDRDQAGRLFRELAGTRSYHGFLAADRLGEPYAMAEQPVDVNESMLRDLYTIPAVVRAHELYRIGDEDNADIEWRQALSRMDETQVLASGRLARQWGWHRNSIQTMIHAGYWDDLELRFPVAHEQPFLQAGRDLGIQRTLLYAVARQESALMADARSPAGARGLMQLMPGTARQTAERLGMDVSVSDLYRPSVNITLGSHYLAEMLDTFGGNRALAAAAYNAGPNRVKQWLRRSEGNPLPLDQWIDTIPYAETRRYVRNVLAYSVIYGERLNEPVAVLTRNEQIARL